MGDFRLSVKVEIAGVEPLNMWINYHEDRRDEVLETIKKYLDRAWPESLAGHQEALRAYHEREERKRREAEIAQLREDIPKQQARLRELEGSDER